MQNRFNRLGSKEWLPFQKSWFRFDGYENLYRSNLRFFCRAEAEGAGVVYEGPQRALVAQICRAENIPLLEPGDSTTPIQFILIDLLDVLWQTTDEAGYHRVANRLHAQLAGWYPQLVHRRFMAVLAPNVQEGASYYTWAWHLAKMLSETLSLKDEKLGCMPAGNTDSAGANSQLFVPQQQIFYSLYFRKDELATGAAPQGHYPFFRRQVQQPRATPFTEGLPAWFVLKPAPRRKKEILHPAKYPEALVHHFVRVFTTPGQVVFDPMSGTGSTQLGALQLGRHAFGTELSDFFAHIARERCETFCTEHPGLALQWQIHPRDARSVTAADTLPIDYLLTSPPYWDMLNMKGAENQAKRIEKGLQTNYSNTPEDLGNLSDYQAFVQELAAIYFNLYELMQPGAYATIVVKNIKKKGSNYPLAWDLAMALQEKFILLPEVCWCQDDLNLAPYGYGNTWVSNTFHQYCLNFQKPLH